MIPILQLRKLRQKSTVAQHSGRAGGILIEFFSDFCYTGNELSVYSVTHIPYFLQTDVLRLDIRG